VSFCALFGVLLLVLLGLAIMTLRRLQLSQAIKLLEVV
jgi:hypothetical protein